MEEKIDVSYETFLDLVNIKDGVFSPIDRFMDNNDLTSVIQTNFLENGDIWPIPVIHHIENFLYSKISEGEEYDLCFDNVNIGRIIIEDKYKIDKNKIAHLVFNTTDKKHPGVNNLFQKSEYAISGKLTFYENLEIKEPFHLTPDQTKERIKEMKWKTIVGFQTRNVPHLAHEYLQRCGLETVDGLFLQPISGWKKQGDYKAEIVFECYKKLIDNYYPKNRVLLCSLSTSMRYAGPREALFHALIRRNYGCTHFIVGRDHAGVGNYYGKYDAHKIFDSVRDMGDIGITPILLYEPFYCQKCNMMATEKTCPHQENERVHMSGTYIRNILLNGGKIPENIMRKEIIQILKNHLNNSESIFY